MALRCTYCSGLSSASYRLFRSSFAQYQLFQLSSVHIICLGLSFVHSKWVLVICQPLWFHHQCYRNCFLVRPKNYSHPSFLDYQQLLSPGLFNICISLNCIILFANNKLWHIFIWIPHSCYSCHDFFFYLSVSSDIDMQHSCLNACFCHIGKPNMALEWNIRQKFIKPVPNCFSESPMTWLSENDNIKMK